MLDTPCGAQIGEQERIIMMKTTTLLLALTLFVPSLFAGPKPKPGTEAQILERLHNKKLRLLLKKGNQPLSENLFNPFRVKYDGFLIIGPTRRFVDETIEGLQRIQKYAPEHYATAKKHVIIFKYLDNWGPSTVRNGAPFVSHVCMTKKDYLWGGAAGGDHFDAVLVHEIQHADHGDGKHYASSGTEPAAYYASWLYCKRFEGFDGGYLAWLRVVAHANGYNQQKFDNRYYK